MVSVTEVLYLVSPTTPIGRVYILSENEVLQMREAYKNFKQ